MRLLRLLSVLLLPLALAACGGAKPTAMPIASAGVLPPLAATTAASTARASDAQQSVAPAVGVTPTPLATSATATPARAGVSATTGRATAAPTNAVPSAVQSTATPQSPKAAHVSDIPATAPQQVIGTTVDGLTLLNVRSGKNEGFTRLVFDLSKADGSAAPVPHTQLWTQGGTVIVAFGGVREDVYAQSLGGGEQQVNLGMVQSIYRIPARDDATAAYGIAVTGGTRVTLSSTTQPTRVIVDIADK